LRGTPAPFSGGIVAADYLELLNTALNAPDSGSQDELVTLAFDPHRARHPAASRQPQRQRRFTGIAFSTTVRLAGGAEGEGTESVESIFPLSALLFLATSPASSLLTRGLP
jgi:hypothetical protein